MLLTNEHEKENAFLAVPGRLPPPSAEISVLRNLEGVFAVTLRLHGQIKERGHKDKDVANQHKDKDAELLVLDNPLQHRVQRTVLMLMCLALMPTMHYRTVATSPGIMSIPAWRIDYCPVSFNFDSMIWSIIFFWLSFFWGSLSFFSP